MKKVVMVLNNSFTNDSRVLREARSLVQYGFKVVIFATKDNNLPQEEIIQGIKIKRVTERYDFRFKPHKIFSQLIPTYKLLKKEKAQVYHSHDFDTLIITFLASSKNKAKFIYDTHEVWSEKTVERKVYKKILYFIAKNILIKPVERFILRRANSVITTSEGHAKLISEMYKISKPSVILNCSVKGNLKKTEYLREKLGLEDEDKIAIYLGGFMKNRGLENLIKASKRFSNNARLVLIGYGPIKSSLERLIEKNSLQKKVFILDAVSQDEVVRVASSADIGVSPVENASKSYYHSAPNKVFEYIASGLAVAASDFPEMKKIVVDNNVGTVFDPENPQEIEEKINELVGNEELLEKMKRNSKKIFLEKYNWEKEEKKLIDVYNNLLSLKV